MDKEEADLVHALTAQVEVLASELAMLHRSLASKPDTATSTGATQALMEYEVEIRNKRNDILQAKVDELTTITFTAYCSGYGAGHNDTVEGMYTPPEDYPEEWPERLAEFVAALKQEEL